MVACLNKDLISAGQIRYAETTLPTAHGEFKMIVYHLQDGFEHVALVKGEVENQPGVLCRIQSECLTSEVFSSLKCDCRQQLEKALALIENQNLGILIYLRQEGRGIGLGNKIRAYNLQENGADTVDANRMLGFPDDGRDFHCAARILRDLNVASVKLMTNNPLKIDGIVNAGIHVVERMSHISETPTLAIDYMKVKGKRMGHYVEGKKINFETIDPILVNEIF